MIHATAPLRYALALLAALTACDSMVDESPPELPPPGGPFVVSNTVQSAVTSAAAFPTSVRVGPVAYVSLPLGTLPEGRAVSIRVRGTDDVQYGLVIGGGLDPIAVPAAAGDTLAITVSGTTGSTSYSYGVPPTRPPTIIRTYPQGNKRDVPLNLRVKVVVSEPIDPSTLTANVELRRGGVAVAGQVGFGNAEGTEIEFVPASPLAPATSYELVLREGLRDSDGAPIDLPVSLSFTTAGTAEPVTQLAFVRDGEIHLINSDGTGLIQLTHTGEGVLNADPAWSPDGSRLAFASDRGGEWDIYVMNSDGSNVVRRTNTGYNVEPAWSPNGQKIAFTSVQYDSAHVSAGIWVMDAADGAKGTTLLDRPGYDVQAAWVPHGLSLTFTSDWRAYDFVYDLYVMNADGSNVRPLLEGPLFWDDGPTYYFQSAWSPDGQRFAVVVCGWAFENCYPDSAIAIANADGTGLRIIASSGGYSRPAWSPDGSTIVFSSAPCSDGCQPSLRMVRVDGSGESLFLPNGHSPAWRRR